jgi:putative DNA-invertase from lambdoid prophage Rac
MRIGLYARVSTEDQNTLPMQMQALQKYVASRNWTVALQIEDVGSGSKERPKRDELLKAARRRDVDAILAWKLDRWGRSVTDLSNTLTELNHPGVGFISIAEALDLTTPTG